MAAALFAVRTMSYAKGFDDATLLREFCEPMVEDTTYWPLADSRPKTERLGWPAS